MVRLLGDEFKKLRGTWFLGFLLVAMSFAPVFAVIGARSNALLDVRAVFDFEAVLTQFFLNAVMVFHPLTFGILAAVVFQREYQNRTLQALLLVPRTRRDLVTAKLLFVSLVSLGCVTCALGLVLTLGAAAGASGFSWDLVVTSGLPIFVTWLAGLPCLAAVFAVSIVSRNLVASVAFCLVALFTGAAAATGGNAAFYNPWSLPFVLGATPQMLLNQGLDPSLVPRSWAVFTAFCAAAFGGTYWLFERTPAD